MTDRRTPGGLYIPPTPNEGADKPQPITVQVAIQPDFLKRLLEMVNKRKAKEDERTILITLDEKCLNHKEWKLSMGVSDVPGEKADED